MSGSAPPGDAANFSLRAAQPARWAALNCAAGIPREGSHMKGYTSNIEALTEANNDFRRVLYTASHVQLVLMTLRPGEDIGEEVHEENDQFFRVEQGKGEVVIDGHITPIAAGSAIVVPAGSRHNVTNSGHEPLKMYTLYGPPHHVDGTVHHTKLEAVRSTEHFAGVTSE